MLTTKGAPPTDQRAGVRPISFLLQNGKEFGAPVTLKIRPTDLTKTEPSRVTLHQTLGRDVQGWSDNFGAGLPTVVISGHTGWRSGGQSGMDGAAAFEQLNNLVMRDYHASKQRAIDSGIDPATVKLLFIDMLDDFAWNVSPTSFVLRRSRSQPLLFNYNMTMQAISTEIDNPLKVAPLSMSVAAGVKALGGLVDKLESMSAMVQGWVLDAIALKDRLLAPLASAVKRFYDMSMRIFNAVNNAVSSVKSFISSTANSLIKIASDIAGVGINIFRTISSIMSLPGYLKSALMRVAGAFNEALCILRNSLKPRKIFEDYDGIYGASNCSSTSGGRQNSAYTNMNAFSLMQTNSPVIANNDAINNISELNRGDPVFYPTDLNTLGGKLDAITDGVDIEAEAA